MCRFGTFVRSVARTEEKISFTKANINAALNQVYTAPEGAIASFGQESYMRSRIDAFQTHYCDTGDNNNGLGQICDRDMAGLSDEDRNRVNKDIDFTRTLDQPLTINIDYDKDKAADTADEQDLYALGQHLYWPQAYNPPNEDATKRKEVIYTDLRRIFAANNVAHNSFASIAALKASSEEGLGAESGWNFMKALYSEFGVPDEEIHKTLGDFPSYYAQMEVLTKKIYQSPEFYTNLYDKPANVRRAGVSMDAIKLMQGRDHFNASLRREMLLSMMVEQEIAAKAKDLQSAF